MVRRILVLHVDGDSVSADVTATLLERAHDRIEVIVDHSARAGIARVAADDAGVDCIVSDYDMPRMNGLDFLEVIRDRKPHLPFILFTGTGRDRLERVATECGVTAYFEKDTDPATVERMAHRISRAVRVYRADQLWDPTGRRPQIRRHGRPRFPPTP